MPAGPRTDLLPSLALVICVILTAPGWSPRRWLLATLCMGLGISVLMMLLSPEERNYAGHSGILYGLFVLGATSLYRRDRQNRN